MKKIKKKHGTKEYAQYIHATRRLKERYDIEITDQEYSQLVNYIKKGKTHYSDGTEVICLGRQSLRITLWCIFWRTHRLYAVYDKIHKTIATFLPYEWATKNGMEGAIDDSETALLGL